MAANLFGRRELLLGAAAIGVTGTIETDPAETSTEGTGTVSTYTTRTIGGLEITALLDARGAFPAAWTDAFPNASDTAWQAARRLDPDAFGADGLWHLVFHCFAIRRPNGRITLIDTGVGPEGSPASDWAPVPGRLPRALPEAGIDPADVDLVVMTHLHGDHIGWAVLPDGSPLFPNARYVVQHAEIESLDPSGTAWSYVVEPLRRAGQLHQVRGSRGLPGGRGTRVRLLPTPGHTPGHQSVLLSAGRDELIVTGDVLVHAVQLVDPDVAYVHEMDQATAAETRRTLLGRPRHTDAVLATAHLTNPFVPLSRCRSHRS